MPDWAAAAITGVMGLLQGATVPTLVIICCDVFPERTASATSIVVFGVSLGVDDLARGHGRGHRLGGAQGRHAQRDRLHRRRRALPAQAEMRRPVYKGARV